MASTSRRKPASRGVSPERLRKHLTGSEAPAPPGLRALDGGNAGAAVQNEPAVTTAATAPDSAVDYGHEWHNLQVNVPVRLHDRYRRIVSSLKLRERQKVEQREWIAALLHEGPQTPSELRDLVERVWPQVQQEFRHDPVKSVVNGHIPMLLRLRYDEWVDNLLFDERYKTSVTKVMNCLMFEGPQTNAELLDLVQRWRQVAP